MAPDVRRLSRDMLVWMVGIATAGQSLARALEAGLDGRRDLVALYLFVMVALLVLAVSIERIKGFLEA